MSIKLFSIKRMRKSTRRAIGSLSAGFIAAVVGASILAPNAAHARDECQMNLILHGEEAREGQLVNPMQESRQPDSYIGVVYGPARGQGSARTVEHRFGGQQTLEGCMDKLTKCWKKRERSQFRYCIKFDGSGNLDGYYQIN